MSEFSLFGWYWDWQDTTMRATAEQEARIQERKRQEQADLTQTVTYEEGDALCIPYPIETVSTPRVRDLFIGPGAATAKDLCKQLDGTSLDIFMDIHALAALSDVDWKFVTLHVAGGFPHTTDSNKIDQIRRTVVLLVSRGMTVKRWIRKPIGPSKTLSRWIQM